MKSKLLPGIWLTIKCVLCCIFFQSFFYTSLWANDKHAPFKYQAKLEVGVSGHITDQNGIALSGVNVIEKGTNNGVTSDKDGKYSLTVKDNKSILVISYVGYVN